MNRNKRTPSRGADGTPRQGDALRSLKKRVARLEKALTEERRENAALKRRIADLNGGYGTFDIKTLKGYKVRRRRSTPKREQQDMLRAASINARRFSKKSYVRYLIHTVKESTVGLIFRRISVYFRRFRLIRRIAAVVAAVLMALLLSAFFITALPFLLLLLVATLMAVILRAHSANRRMREYLRDVRRVRILILSEQVTFEDSTFAERSAKAMATEAETAVIVVTPRLWSAKGLGGEGMFFTARRESQNLYLVRRGYYFILRRRILDGLACDMTVIY